LKGRVKKIKAENPENQRSSCLSVQELEESETYWIKQNQKSLQNSLAKGQFLKLDPITDSKYVIRVGGRVDKTIATYDTRHAVLVSKDHWTSKLVTRQAHQYGHSGEAATVAKIRRKYSILRAHNLAKSYECVFCKKIEAKCDIE
jgi:hypothetical protein